MKKYTGILSALCVLMLSLQCVASGLNEFDKSSYSDYLGSKLTCTEQQLLTFDEDIYNGGEYTTEGKTDGCISFTTSRSRAKWQLINTPTDSFHMNVTDKFKQTVKLWVYVNDIDLLVCDHDAVYDTPQNGSGTLYITLSNKNGGTGHTWQHTFFGSGWHELELAVDCHNVAYNNLQKINYGDLTSLKIWCNAKAGLELRFDDMRLCTYDNTGYTQPEAPYGGRWLSTCDYEALDGVILTEWYGACFDTEQKTQGSSSVTITGHKENVDHRVCIGIDDVSVVYKEDTVCFDMYINDPELLGEDWQLRFEHNAQAAFYSLGYAEVIAGLVDENMKRTYLKSGWNHLQIPLSSTNVRIGEGYEDNFTDDLTLTQLVFYIAGTGNTDAENYVIKYDNIYVAKTADLKAAKAEIAAASVTDAVSKTDTNSYTAAITDNTTEHSQTDSTIVENNTFVTKPVIIIIAMLLVVTIISVIIVKKRAG